MTMKPNLPSGNLKTCPEKNCKVKDECATPSVAQPRVSEMGSCIFCQRFPWPFPYRALLEVKDDILPGGIEEDRGVRIHRYQPDRLLSEALQWAGCRILRVLKEYGSSKLKKNRLSRF